LTFTDKRKLGLTAVIVLGLIQSVLRFAITGLILQTGFPATEKYVSPDVQAFIIWAFVLIGIAGVITSYGLLTGARWGFFGTFALSLATIAFDQWAIEEVQVTAMLGIVLPVLFIVYLFAYRSDFIGKVRNHESPGGVRN
jgi:hypothetical protein